MSFPTLTAYSKTMENIDKQIIEKARDIDLVVFDVDGVLTDGGIYISENGEESKRFFCEQCNKGFTTKVQFSYHENVHTGLKPYKCQYCNMCYQNTSNRRTHQRKSHPER